MEITGQKTIKTDEISVTSNPYLEEIEAWNEQDLPHYKKKVKDKMFSGYISIVLGGLIAYVLYLVFYSCIAAMFTGAYNALCGSFVGQWICMGIFYVIVFILVWLYGKKMMVKFVASCHGEIGHDGNPFMRRLMFHIIFSGILCVVGTVIAILVFNENGTSSMGLLVLETYLYLPAIISPFAYFVGTLSARNEMIQCPVCGRFETVYKRKISDDFGERQDGQHKEYDYKTERVGTKTITTYYSDGSKDSRSEGIYGSVRYTKEYDDYSNLAKYIYLCRECSYVEETIEEKSWKTLRTKYRG